MDIHLTPCFTLQRWEGPRASWGQALTASVALAALCNLALSPSLAGGPARLAWPVPPGEDGVAGRRPPLREQPLHPVLKAN